MDLNVIKRNGDTEVLSYDKIAQRIKQLNQGTSIQSSGLVMKIMDQLHDMIQTSKIDELIAEQCASMGIYHYDYSILAGRMIVSNHQKEVQPSFEVYIKTIHEIPNYISQTYYDTAIKHLDFFESILDHSRDFLIDYFGFKTLERAYLIRSNGKIVERIQHLWLRVAIQIHGEDLKQVKETYDSLSRKEYIHATPTLFNSGILRPQLSSCFLLGMEDDSIDGIFNVLKIPSILSSSWNGRRQY